MLVTCWLHHEKIVIIGYVIEKVISGFSAAITVLSSILVLFVIGLIVPSLLLMLPLLRSTVKQAQKMH